MEYTMADETIISNGVLTAVGGAILTGWLSFMAYFARKRDATLDDTGKAITALELKIAENYATKPTVLALFQEATQQTKDAVARVEKSIDCTNLSVCKLDTKIDKVVESIGSMQTNVLHELSKKT
jgi:hypothetical protein